MLEYTVPRAGGEMRTLPPPSLRSTAELLAGKVLPSFPDELHVTSHVPGAAALTLS